MKKERLEEEVTWMIELIQKAKKQRSDQKQSLKAYNQGFHDGCDFSIRIIRTFLNDLWSE